MRKITVYNTYPKNVNMNKLTYVVLYNGEMILTIINFVDFITDYSSELEIFHQVNHFGKRDMYDNEPLSRSIMYIGNVLK